MMRLPRLLLALLLSTAQGALAVSPGGTLYIKSKDAPLLKEPKAKAAKLDTLQPGTAVTWLGVSEKDKQFHQVQAGAKKGFVLRSDLTPQKPQAELSGATGQPMSAQAFANSGATKGQPSSGSYAASKGPDVKAAAAELATVEELNEKTATPQAVAEKNKSLH